MIEIRPGRLGRSVFAVEPLRRGQVLWTGWGERVPDRTRLSIQVDHDTHIDFPTPLCLVNHSCEPNCGLLIHNGRRELELHALRDIVAGEELSWDYATAEYEILFMPSHCLCRSARCRGRITGYKDLPAERRRAYGRYVARYLREREAAVLAEV
jgi:hypothetical protein